MNWEVSARYITNYVPVIILLSTGGVRYLVNYIQEKGIDKKISSAFNRNLCEIKIFIGAVCFRLVIYLLSVCVMAIMGDYSTGITFSDFLETWKRWDSAHYINIAENGYAGAIENGEHIFLVFYPLYPWLMKAISVVIKDIRLCGMLISVVSYAVGSVFFYKITKKEFDSKAAENALIMISIFPFAFFFGSIATEALFFAVTAAFFYYLGKHEWNWVAFWGFLACLTKVQGILLAFAVLIELFYYKRGISLIKQHKWKSFIRRIIYPGCIAATMLLGIVIYLLVNYIVEGDPFRFMYYQKAHWNNELCPIWKTIGYIKQNALSSWFTSMGMSIWIPELLLFAGYLAAIVYGSVRKIRPMYLIYLIAFFLLTYSSTWLISGGRYTLSALPVFMLAGDWLSRHEKWKMPVMLLSAMLMFIYMTGYYEWKQIM
jgi:Gpi18-like mannosyltransferase